MEILKRGSALDPEQLRRDLRLAGTDAGEPGADPGGRRADRAGLPTCAIDRVGFAAVAGQGTPATALLVTQKVAHTAPVRRTADAPNYGAWWPRRSASTARVFKTLVTEVDGR